MGLEGNKDAACGVVGEIGEANYAGAWRGVPTVEGEMGAGRGKSTGGVGRSRRNGGTLWLSATGHKSPSITHLQKQRLVAISYIPMDLNQHDLHINRVMYNATNIYCLGLKI